MDQIFVLYVGIKHEIWKVYKKHGIYIMSNYLIVFIFHLILKKRHSLHAGIYAPLIFDYST